MLAIVDFIGNALKYACDRDQTLCDSEIRRAQQDSWMEQALDRYGVWQGGKRAPMVVTVCPNAMSNGRLDKLHEKGFRYFCQLPADSESRRHFILVKQFERALRCPSQEIVLDLIRVPFCNVPICLFSQKHPGHLRRICSGHKTH
jgi:hypothetical protein